MLCNEFGFMDDCKTNVRVNLFQAQFKKRFVSGHDFSRAEKSHQDEGFSPCGATSLSVRLRAGLGSSICEEDITLAAFNSR
jgi:hypothetical protein